LALTLHGSDGITFPDATGPFDGADLDNDYSFVSTNTPSSTPQYMTFSSLASGVHHHFVFTNIIPVTDAQTLECQFSQGGSFATSGYDQNGNVSEITVANITIGNGADQGFAGRVIFYNPRASSSVNIVTIGGVGLTATPNAVESMEGGAFLTNQNACDGIRFFFASGDFQDVGTIIHYTETVS
jgi:hypothetical protein